MKEISGLTDLLKVILYDILGLIIPGIFLFILLLLLISYCQNPVQPFGIILQAAHANGITLYVMIFTAYILGYFLQSVSFLHSKKLDGLGAQLLGLSDPAVDVQATGTSPSTRFVEEHYTKKPFYAVARAIIAQKAGLKEPTGLGFSDVSSLAFSFAREEADVVRQFRFRADFCGAISTLALLAALVLIPALVLQGNYRWYWCTVPVLLAIWVSALSISSRRRFLKFLTHRTSSLLPPLIILIGLVSLKYETGQGRFIVWMVPALVLVWFFMLWRHYFYLQLGGTVHFSIAVAAIAREDGVKSAPK
jgi:hypothetical protein